MKLTRSVSRITANSVLSGAIFLLGMSGVMNAQDKTYKTSSLRIPAGSKFPAS